MLASPWRRYSSCPPKVLGWATWRNYVVDPRTPIWAVPYHRNDTDGLPGPSLELRYNGAFRLLWPVEAGTRIFTVWCRHSGHSPRPRVRVAAAPSLGVTSDVIVEAQDTTEWHKLSVSVNVTATGVLEVFLEHRSWTSHTRDAWTRWDNASAG